MTTIIILKIAKYEPFKTLSSPPRSNAQKFQKVNPKFATVTNFGIKATIITQQGIY
jgi:hypothetical protein